MAMALDVFSTLLLIMNAHPQHNISIEIELMLPLAVVDGSCAFVFVVVALSMQIHCQGYPEINEIKIRLCEY